MPTQASRGRWAVSRAAAVVSLLAASVSSAGCGTISEDPVFPAGAERDEARTVSDHWSLIAPARPAPPSVSNAAWVKNPIDQFVLHQLEAAGIEPSAPASATELLRRVSLDLTGLPPPVEDIRELTADPSDATYAALVERLLDDPAFGEHRARYWLDVARYADTHGYHFDNYRSIWPYRDYVIEAFSSGKPFDTFTHEQLAGDLLPGAGVEQHVATGFIRSGMSTNEGGVDADEYAAIYAKDRVDTLASAWLGLTVGCAACHDHLYDPIKQREFYQLTAFFRNSTEPVLDGNLADAPPSVAVPPSMATTLVTAERPTGPFDFVLERGRYDAPGELVTANVPRSLPVLPEGVPRNRLGLARWLTAEDHPLMARVVVNRFWSEVFGAGIVRTVNDFGRIGDLPSHPELLDWLAVEFRESGWDVKHLFRLIVTSSTYRQSASASPEAFEADAGNRQLARGPRFRMDGEMVRDLALAASGLLVRTVGGPSVMPYQPENIWEPVALPESDTSRYTQGTGEQLYRRSLYTFWKRQAPPPFLEVFDAPTREQSTALRERTNSALQALATLNDVQMVEAARVLATHALEAEQASEARLDYMARRVLSRPLVAAEAAVLLRLLEAELGEYEKDAAAAIALVGVGESAAPAALPAPALAAWTLVANTLLNLDEALTK